MTVALSLGIGQTEMTAKSLTKIGDYRYRLVVKGCRLGEAWLGCLFDWENALTGEPLQHLPFECWMGWTVLCSLAAAKNVPTEVTKIHIGSIRQITRYRWMIELTDGRKFTGCLMDWNNPIDEKEVADPALQFNLSFTVLGWMATNKEHYYQGQMEKLFHAHNSDEGRT